MVEVPTIEWLPSAPILILAATAIVILVIDLIVPQRSSLLSLLLAVAGLGAACVVVVNLVPTGTWLLNDFLCYDSLGRFGAIIVLACGFLIALTSPRTIRLQKLPPAEYYAILLFAVFGMVLVCLSLELLTLFLCIELIGVAFYILVGLRASSKIATEAALKYFILGAFSGGFLIFGFAFLYGGSGGTTRLGEIGVVMVGVHTPWMINSLLLGMAFALAGFAFKLTLVPFHLYAADVYEGAPTPVSALLATGVKVAGFVALLHLLGPFHEHRMGALKNLAGVLGTLLTVLATLSIIIGNVVALLQRNIKRMLAYSSIAHSGYLLIGVLVFVDGSVPLEDIQIAILTYLAAYVVMNVVAFGIAATLGKRGEGNIEDYAGLAQQSPALALAMALAMIALTGIPGTVGFVGKFYVFSKGVEAGFISLVILAVLCSVVSAYYYLRVVVYMYMRDPEGEAAREPVSLVQGLGLVLATLPIVVFGIMPQWLFRLLGAVKESSGI